MTERQRQLERELRYAKRDAALADACEDKEAFDRVSLKVRQKQENRNTLVKVNNSAVSVRRTQALGYKNTDEAIFIDRKPFEERVIFGL